MVVIKRCLQNEVTVVAQSYADGTVEKRNLARPTISRKVEEICARLATRRMESTEDSAGKHYDIQLRQFTRQSGKMRNALEVGVVMLYPCLCQ